MYFCQDNCIGLNRESSVYDTVAVGVGGTIYNEKKKIYINNNCYKSDARARDDGDDDDGDDVDDDDDQCNRPVYADEPLNDMGNLDDWPPQPPEFSRPPNESCCVLYLDPMAACSRDVR